MKIMLIITVFIALSSGMYAENNNYPIGCSPEEIGLKAVERFLESEHMLYAKTIHYAEVCTWYGAVKFAEVTGNKSLLEKLQNRFEPFFTTDKHLLPLIGYKENFNNYVDFNMFGGLPLQFYLLNNDKKYLDLGLRYADSQWELPHFATDKHKMYHDMGLTWQTRFWIDDMYMITIVQSKAYQATGNREYVNRAGKEMVAYLDTLQHDNGLFFHSPDAPFYWGRGNGWMAVGMAELLRYLPEDNQYRPVIEKGYCKMMESLKKCWKANGTWGQLIDKSDSRTETSGSAMFLYAIITGVKNGWLDKSEYEEVIRKGWLGLVSYVNNNGELTEVCIGTGKKNDEQFYRDRPRKTGDFHGQGPLLWCAYALLENN
jgi:Predicted unsaturated glucuronyl hydrolase involved in regulation of bacterial surface properties, and related proteins